MVAAANARADQARDAALVEAAGTLEDQALDADAQAKRFRGGSDPWADRTARSRALRNSAAAILALRDKPAPAVLPLLPDMVDAATAAGVVVWWDNEAQEIKMAVTVQEAARVLLDAFMRKDIDPLDAVDPQIEALAIKHSGNRGDPVIQLEIAEEFFCASLRSIAASEA